MAVAECVVAAGGVVVGDHGQRFDVDQIIGGRGAQYQLQAVAVLVGGVPQAGGGIQPATLAQGQAQDVQVRYQVVDRASGRWQNGDLAAGKPVVEVLQHRPDRHREVMIHDLQSRTTGTWARARSTAHRGDADQAKLDG